MCKLNVIKNTASLDIPFQYHRVTVYREVMYADEDVLDREQNYVVTF